MVSTLKDAELVLRSTYIPSPDNEVIIDGLRVFYHDGAQEKDRIIRRIQELLANKVL